MDTLQEAIEKITYWNDDHFSEEALKTILANKDEALPYLRGAVEHALEKREAVETDYQLHFYALYLLGEFQDREFFPKIVEFASIPGKELDFLVGDCVTADLHNILYNTYDGNMELLKNAIQDRAVNEFARASMLDVLGQLYSDGILAEADWKDFLKQCIYDGGEYDYIYDAIGYMICRCHFFDMLPQIRYLFQRDALDEMCMGKYDDFVDAVFEYQEDDNVFCRTPMDAVKALRKWTCFSQEPGKDDAREIELNAEKLFRLMARERSMAAKKIKIGRNDPCPCGSGKKYKFCCLKKPLEAIDRIESREERMKWLKSYPYTGKERVEGRIYLGDYFDEASIDVDKILYLALQNRHGLLFEGNSQEDIMRKREYLYLAFGKCIERMEKEQIRSFAEYDEKYSIHYFCEEWIGELSSLLEQCGDLQTFEEVTGRAGRFRRPRIPQI